MGRLVGEYGIEFTTRKGNLVNTDVSTDILSKAANPAHEQADPSEDNRSDDYGIDAPEELRQYHTECPITYS